MQESSSIKELVDRFLAWPLPESVCSDQCATERSYPNRTGTTLLTAIETEEMLQHVLEPLLVEKKALQYHVDMAEHEIDRLKKENAILMERLLRAT